MPISSQACLVVNLASQYTDYQAGAGAFGEITASITAEPEPKTYRILLQLGVSLEPECCEALQLHNSQGKERCEESGVF